MVKLPNPWYLALAAQANEAMYKQPALPIQALSTFPTNSNPLVILYLRICTVITLDDVKRRTLSRGPCMPWKPIQNCLSREFRNYEDTECDLKEAAPALVEYSCLTLRNSHPTEKSMNKGGSEGPLNDVGLMLRVHI